MVSKKVADDRTGHVCSSGRFWCRLLPVLNCRVQRSCDSSFSVVIISQPSIYCKNRLFSSRHPHRLHLMLIQVSVCWFQNSIPERHIETWSLLHVSLYVSFQVRGRVCSICSQEYVADGYLLISFWVTTISRIYCH